MENNKESEIKTFLRVKDVMKLMDCGSTKAYDKINLVKSLLKNPESVVGVKVKITDFVNIYKDYTIEQCLQVIQERDTVVMKSIPPITLIPHE